jgi:transcriptional regulator with XRE-family HTH domain
MEFSAGTGMDKVEGPLPSAPRDEDDETRIDREIGRVVRRLRLGAGLSQQAVARKIGTSFQQVQKYERGVNRIPLSRLILLCDALGVTVVDVVGEVVEIVRGAPDSVPEKPATLESRLGARAMAAVSRVEDPEVLEAVIRLLDTVNAERGRLGAGH